MTVYAYTGTANKISNGDSGSELATVDAIQLSTTGFLTRNQQGSTITDQAIMFHYVADSEL